MRMNKKFHESINSNHTSSVNENDLDQVSFSFNIQPDLECSFCTYIENFRKFDEFNKSPDPNKFKKSTGARFLTVRQEDTHILICVFIINKFKLHIHIFSFSFFLNELYIIFFNRI